MTPAERLGGPALVACAHGTRDVHGRRAIGALVAAVAAARPGLHVEAAFVDVQRPTVAEVVARAGEADGGAVVVPLLLSSGYHVGVDIAAAVTGHRAAAAPALGPDDQVTAVLLDRLAEVGTRAGDVVVLAAAGSSDPAATGDVARVADVVRDRHLGPVEVGYGASAHPLVADVVQAARRAHPARRVVIASYLLAPGHFHGRLLRASADLVSDPLLRDAGAPDPRLVRVVLDRYDSARDAAALRA